MLGVHLLTVLICSQCMVCLKRQEVDQQVRAYSGGEKPENQRTAGILDVTQAARCSCFVIDKEHHSMP